MDIADRTPSELRQEAMTNALALAREVEEVVAGTDGEFHYEYIESLATRAIMWAAIADMYRPVVIGTHGYGPG